MRVTLHTMPWSQPLSDEIITSLVREAFGPTAVLEELTRLQGGLESAVARLRIALPSPSGRSGVRSAVIKRLGGNLRREAALYRALGNTGVAPRVLASADAGDATYLLLEFVTAVSAWPWRDEANTRLVVRELARVHEIEQALLQVAPWDYDSELDASARATVQVAEQVRHAVPETGVAAELSRIQRVAERLVPARHQLMAEFGTSVIHGDAHPGNIIVRGRGKERRAVFLDWARTRCGSRLEDVASLLQTLRFWEPRVMQRHDTLLRGYVQASGIATDLTSSLRDGYAIAAASNVFAGALRFHLLRATESSGATREAAVAQARDGLRIIRRADASLRR